MRLSEYIDQQPVDKVLFIGCATNFIFVGTKETYYADVEIVNANMRKRIYKLIETVSKNLVDCLTEGEPTEDIVEYYYDKNNAKRKRVIPKDTAVKRFHEKVESCRNTINEMSAYLENYVHLSDREVIEVRERVIEKDGTIVIVEGIDNGSFWFRHEYEEKYKLERINA